MASREVSLVSGNWDVLRRIGEHGEAREIDIGVRSKSIEMG